jgi:hypothetical protein
LGSDGCQGLSAAFREDAKGFGHILTAQLTAGNREASGQFDGWLHFGFDSVDFSVYIGRHSTGRKLLLWSGLTGKLFSLAFKRSNSLWGFGFYLWAGHGCNWTCGQGTHNRTLGGTTSNTSKGVNVVTFTLKGDVLGQALLTFLRTFGDGFFDDRLAKPAAQCWGKTCTANRGEELFHTLATSQKAKASAKGDLVEVSTEVGLGTLRLLLGKLRVYASFNFGLVHAVIDGPFDRASTLGCTNDFGGLLRYRRDCADRSSTKTQGCGGRSCKQRRQVRNERTQSLSGGLQGGLKHV